MQFESSSSKEEVADDDMDLQAWSEIGSDSDTELQEDYGIIEEVMPTSVNRYAEQHFQTQDLRKRSKTVQWKSTTNEEMLKFLGIII